MGDLTYIPYGAAGLVVLDISDVTAPTPVGRLGLQPPEALVLQSEDVLVDTRGYIYLSNKNQGVWILRFTGQGNG